MAKKSRKTKKAPKQAKGTRKRAGSRKKVAAVPQGYHTVNAHLVVRGAADAIAYYKRAFGAKERTRMPGPDGKIAHAEIAIGDCCVMLADEMPQMGATAPPSVGGTPVTLSLYVPDVDRVFKQAVAAGGKVTMPVADMFWGDRYGQLVDPFGHKWAIATHIEDVSAREMARRAEAFAQQGQPGQPPAA